MTKRRVVVTGMGALTPLGLSVEESWERIKAAQSGVTRVESFDVTAFNSQICAAVKGFDPIKYLSPKDIRKNDVFIQYGVAAAVQAMEQAGLEITEANCARVGVAVGSGIGGLPMIEKNAQAYAAGGPRKISPTFIPGAIVNLVAGHIAMRFGMKGPNMSIVTACTTGAHNIGYAARTIAYGDADVMIAGGSEMAISPLGIGGFAAMRALSRRNDDPERASRPWDRDRDGFVLGSGAGIIVLEEYEQAKARGATIFAELAGFGMSADAYHTTLPDPEGRGAAASMQNAIHDAGLNPEDVHYINAHGTSTPAGDELEAIAIKKTFGADSKVLVSSTKSMTGHLLGAAGAVEAIFCILALRDHVAPPTINLDNPDENCDLDFVPHESRQATIDVSLSNSFGFGGTNGSLIFCRV